MTTVSQLVAISRWGLYTTEILWWSLGLSAVALLAFWLQVFGACYSLEPIRTRRGSGIGSTPAIPAPRG